MNAGWRQFTGRAADEPGADWQEGLHPEDRARYRETVAAAMAAHRGWEVEFRLRRADGVYRWLLERAVPIGPDRGVGRQLHRHQRPLPGVRAADPARAVRRRAGERARPRGAGRPAGPAGDRRAPRGPVLRAADRRRRTAAPGRDRGGRRRRGGRRGRDPPGVADGPRGRDHRPSAADRGRPGGGIAGMVGRGRGARPARAVPPDRRAVGPAPAALRPRPGARCAGPAAAR